MFPDPRWLPARSKCQLTGNPAPRTTTCSGSASAIRLIHAGPVGVPSAVTRGACSPASTETYVSALATVPAAVFAAAAAGSVSSCMPASVASAARNAGAPGRLPVRVMIGPSCARRPGPVASCGTPRFGTPAARGSLTIGTAAWRRSGDTPMRPRTWVMRLATLAVGAALTIPAAWASPQPEAATGAAPEAGVWTPKEVDFAYRAFTSRYTCDSLRDKVRGIVLKLGARADAKVLTYGCLRGPHPEQLPNVRIRMHVLQPAPNDSTA